MATELTLQSTLPLPNTSLTIPHLGFGVYQSNGDICVRSCQTALEAGYRHIDSAQYYANEALVQTAIATQPSTSAIERSKLFLTTKILSSHGSVDADYASIASSVEKIGGKAGYADLFLIHSPSSGAGGRKRLWQALERANTDGTVRAIGVSNFGIGHIEEMKAYAKVWPPHVNQIELHPWCQQREIVDYCRRHGIVVQAYCPLVRNRKAKDESLQKLAAKHNKSTGQVLIRWCLQKGFVPLPKSDTPERIRANADVYDFELDDGDMRELDAKDQGASGAIVEAVRNSA